MNLFKVNYDRVLKKALKEHCTLNEKNALKSIGYSHITKETKMEELPKIDEGIERYGITQIKVKRSTVYITLSRPGIFIGLKGENIDRIRNYLSKEFNKKVKIKLTEERLLRNLTNFMYAFSDY